MTHMTSVELTRDCEATEIPSGLLTTLPGGTHVDVRQKLGGNFTVHTRSALFQIAGKDADALGFGTEPDAEQQREGKKVVDEKAVWDVLKTCYDPEIPVNIVDLGLVYNLRLEVLPSGGSAVSVQMTLTAPGCGMGGAIAGDAQEKLLNLPGIERADVQIVWDPPWHPTLISEEGRKILGLE